MMRQYRALTRNCNLAQLTGIILGDGNLYKHPRTENLRIVCNSKDTIFIQHVAALIKKVFNKKPSVHKRKYRNAINVNLYQKHISQQLGIPAGNKIKNDVGIPAWIYLKKGYMIGCLKGLFETDGCFQEDNANYAQYIEFKNNCKELLKNVYSILVKLSFNPQFGRNYIRLAKKNEVYRFKKLIDFRNYIAL